MTARGAPVLRSNAFDLRLIGDKKPTLYVANLPVTGKESRRHNLMGGGGVISLVILGAAAVGAYVIYDKVFDDEDDEAVPN